MPGHSVLQLPVPALEEWVRSRTAHYDVGFVSADPRFGHAHITALGPFDPNPSVDALTTVADLAHATAPIPVGLADLAQFPNGIIHLVPDPADRLRDLTVRLMAAFPDRRPYGGAFGDDVQPHLTVDAASDDVDLTSTANLLADVVPVACVLDRLQLAWWESGDCHVMHEWRLGAEPATESGQTPRESAEHATLGVMRRLALLVLAVALLVAVPRVAEVTALPAQVADPSGAREEGRTRAVVVRVTDGDTLKVRMANGSEKDVRILGIDTPEVYPELECGGEEGTAGMAALAPVGSKVLLVSDPTQGDRDQYGRLLRYVHRSGKDVGLAQLTSGRARVFIFRDDPLRRAEAYRKAERRARNADRGSWDTCWR